LYASTADELADTLNLRLYGLKASPEKYLETESFERDVIRMPNVMETKRDLNIPIAVAVKRLRELNGYTQLVLAEKAHVTQPEISLIENGKRNNLNTLEQVSLALGKKLSEMIQFAEEVGDKEKVLARTREFLSQRHKSRSA